jgi:hypothetical protein
MKELFSNRDPNAPSMVQCFKNQFYGFAPTPYDGCYVIFNSYANPKASNFVYEDFNKYLLMSCDAHVLHNGAYSESIQVFDFKNVRMGHIMKSGIKSVRNFLHFLEDASSVDVKAVHVLNASNVMKFVLGKCLIKLNFIKN